MVKRPTIATPRMRSANCRSTSGNFAGSIALPMPIFATIQPDENVISNRINKPASPRTRFAFAIWDTPLCIYAGLPCTANFETASRLGNVPAESGHGLHRLHGLLREPYARQATECEHDRIEFLVIPET